MKNISAPMKGVLAHEVMPHVPCLAIGHRIFLTGHGQDVTIQGQLYQATGFVVSGLSTDLDAHDKPLEVSLVRETKTLETLRSLICLGQVKVRYFMWDPVSQGILLMRAGTLGDLYIEEQRVTFQLMSLTHDLGRDITQNYRATCAAQLGDQACKIDLNTYLKSVEVIEIEPQIRVQGDLKGNWAALTWLTGKNQGFTSTIRQFDENSGVLTFSLPLMCKIELGDKANLIPGCDKSLRCCRERYNNILNFRGQPFIPG